MSFNSLTFVIFLPIVFAVYWSTPNKFKWVVILIGSYYFYMSWNAKYAILILLITAISYISALLIKSCKNKKLPVFVSVFSSLIILFIFKYFNFFTTTLDTIFRIKRITLDILLPVGISFYTFQALSYVIDVYKGKVQAERHFGKYAAFISFFPQLVAGPIERTENLLPQINEPKKFDYEKATYGLKLMAWGFFKKMVIADKLAIHVNEIFGNLSSYQGFVLITTILYFSIQIYCDFSGYSDIAIGVAKLFGIDLMTNFKSPYLSSSIKEFWSRWHISLSSWFRDYVYIPLGGNRCGRIRNSLNLFITFLLSGLWHGANWTFVIWGGIHGLLQIVEKFIFKPKQKTNLLKILVVFILICLSWVFFRAQSLNEAIYIFTNMFKGISNPISYILTGLKATGGKKPIFIYFIILLIYDTLSLKFDCIEKIGKLALVARWGIYIVFTFAISFTIFSNPEIKETKFVYFQF